MGKPLIVTKYLIPGRRSDLLRRPRLIEFLHEHVDRKLVLVCAPAGYGKTSLLAEYAHDTDLPLCWYSLDPSDRDLRVFVDYLLASIRHRFPDFGRRTQDLLDGMDNLQDTEALLGVLVNEIYEQIPDYFVIVLDDYHLANPGEAVNRFLDGLLQRLPENCHLIIASRTIPTLTPRGLAMLTARQEVAGLGARELRFAPQEIQDLVRQNYHQDLPDDVAQDLARQSEGWITGILLTTQTMWKGLFASVSRAWGANSNVYDYLANEVFALQPPPVQRFLLGSAILEEMSAARCDELLEITDSAAMLSLLEKDSIFIERLEKGEQRWYRYHALFQSFLRTKLHADDPEREQLLHRRAAATLERDGDWGAALQHYLAAGNADAALRVVMGAAEAEYDAGHFQTLAQWIDQLPAEALARAPRLSWYRGQAHQEMAEWSQSLAWNDRARQGFAAAGDREAVAQTLVDRAVTLRLMGRVRDAAVACREALEILAQLPQWGKRTPRIAASAHRNLGISLCQLGDLQAGTEELRQALDLYGEPDSRYGLALTHGDLGVALRLAGNLAGSELHFEEALHLWQEIGHPGNIANALNSLAVGQHLRGELELALATFEQALNYAQRAGSRRLQAFVWAGQGDVHRDLRHWDQAMEAYKESWQLAEAVHDPSLLGYLLNAQALVHQGRGEPQAALALARQAYERAQERGLIQDAARYEVTLARLFLQQGSPTLAGEYLERAEKTFVHNGAKRELATTYLHLARVAVALDAEARALAYVRQMADIIIELGYDQGLIREAAEAVPVLERAVAAGIGAETLGHLLDSARRLVAQAPAQPAAQAHDQARAHIAIQALGEPTVIVNGAVISASDWGTAKAKELFFYLVSFPARRKEQIGSVLWPDLSPGRLRSAFHVTVYRLRRALGINDCILYDNEQYLFNRQLDYTFDVEEFEALISRAERQVHEQPRQAEEDLQRAVELYRGDFLESMTFPDEEWCVWRREELGRSYLRALQLLGDLRLRRHDYHGALEAYRRAVARDPLKEEAHRGIMCCLAALGERNAALRHYQNVAAQLRDELGVSPLPETVGLYHLIADQRDEAAS